MSEESDPPQTSAPSGDVARAWDERGWPRHLLARARELRISNERLERMLLWNTDIAGVELQVAWADRIINGPITARQIQMGDDEEFRDLWANAPEEIGEWDITVERGANAFAQYQLQERPVFNALFDRGMMVACVSFSVRQTIVGGQTLWVRYGQAMRVHKDHRRHGYGNWVRQIPWALGLERPTEVQYDFIRARNMTMERWNRKNMPHVDTVPKRDDDVPGIPVTVLQFPAGPSTDKLAGVRTARNTDLERCVSLINRTHTGRDLFRPYTPEFLAERLSIGVPLGPAFPPAHAYGLDSYFVIERDGQIVACAGLWDRGRDAVERWRHRDSGNERTISVASLLDFGFDEGEEAAMATLIEHLIVATHALGRDYLVASLETLPNVAEPLTAYEPVPETRYLQWRAETPPLTAPPYVDLVYW